MHACTDNEYLRGQLRQDTSDCAAYRAPHPRAHRLRRLQTRRSEWEMGGERVCKNTELGGCSECMSGNGGCG